jgi:hypothetical protein
MTTAGKLQVDPRTADEQIDCVNHLRGRPGCGFDRARVSDVHHKRYKSVAVVLSQITGGRILRPSDRSKHLVAILEVPCRQSFSDTP